VITTPALLSTVPNAEIQELARWFPVAAKVSTFLSSLMLRHPRVLADVDRCIYRSVAVVSVVHAVKLGCIGGLRRRSWRRGDDSSKVEVSKKSSERSGSSTHVGPRLTNTTKKVLTFNARSSGVQKAKKQKPPEVWMMEEELDLKLRLIPLPLVGLALKYVVAALILSSRSTAGSPSSSTSISLVSRQHRPLLY
jgi:hypothetical protein